MIRTISANTVEEALNQIRKTFTDNVNIISILDTNQGVSIRFHTEEAYISRDILDGIETFLNQHQFSVDLKKNIMQNIQSGHYKNADSVDEFLSQIFGLNPLVLEQNTPENPLMLIGYPGSGKTSLALKYGIYMAHTQNRPAHVMSCDVWKAGGVEEIRTLGKKLNVPVSIAVTAEDVQVMLRNLKKHTVVIIDTPSLQPRDPVPHQIVAEIQNLIGSETVWVTRSGHDLVDYVQHYKGIEGLKVKGVALTQTDLSDHISGLLSFCYVYRIPLRSFTGSPLSIATRKEEVLTGAA